MEAQELSLSLQEPSGQGYENFFSLEQFRLAGGEQKLENCSVGKHFPPWDKHFFIDSGQSHSERDITHVSVPFTLHISDFSPVHLGFKYAEFSGHSLNELTQVFFE